MVKQAYSIIISFMILFLCNITICQGAEAKKGPISAEEKRALTKLAKEELNNSVWDIELRPMANNASKKLKKTPDTLRFQDKKIGSDKLIKEGFSTSNYTVRIKGKDNDIVIWETMQTSEESGVAFWRGEVRDGDTMRGVLSWHVTDKKKRDYTFVNKEKEVIIEEEAIAVETVGERFAKPEETIKTEEAEKIPAEVVEIVDAEEVIIAEQEKAVPIVEDSGKAADAEIKGATPKTKEKTAVKKQVEKKKKKRGWFF